MIVCRQMTLLAMQVEREKEQQDHALQLAGKDTELEARRREHADEVPS